MNDDKLTRRDVDTLAAQILITLGVINGAALGASFADINGLSTTPFAIGLIAAIIAQIWWYIDAVLEYSFAEGVFSKKYEALVANIIVNLFTIGGGFLSAGCIVYGCFCILGTKENDALLYSILLCFIPFATLIYIGLRKS